MQKTVVIGLGNTLMKDDGIGPKLVRMIKKSGARLGVRCVEAGIKTIDVLAAVAGADNVLIIDAVDYDGIPGQAILIDDNQINQLVDERAWALNQCGLGTILREMRSAKKKTIIRLIGIQPAEVCWGTNLSDCLQDKKQELAAIVMEQIMRMREGDG